MLALALHRTPRFVVLLLLIIGTLGLAGFISLPRLEDPTLSPRFALIKTFMPGADATRIETEITEVMEKKLLEVNTIRLMRSQSRPGISVVIVELKDNIRDLEPAWAEVREKIDLASAEFPAEASQPEMERTDVRAYAMILGLAWRSQEPVNQALLQRQAQQLEDLILGVSGTEEIKTFGATPEEISIMIDRRKLQGLGLSMTDVQQRFAAQEARTVSGELMGDRNRYVMRTDSAFQSLEDLRSMPLIETAGGGFLGVEAVGSVRRGLQEPPQEKAFVSGDPAVVLGVYAEDKIRVDAWTKRVQAKIAKWTLPPGIELVVLFEQNETVQARFGSLIQNLVLAVLAVMLVVLVMMGARAALVVGAAIPLTTACVLGALSFLEIPIHQMSVTGLIVALGLLIDNAIVVTDELKLEREEGHSEEEALKLVSKRLNVPLTSSTATTVLAFLPIALLPGGTGEFVGTIAVTVIIALLFSLFLSLNVLPSLFFWVMRTPKPKRDLWNSPRLVALYRWLFARPFLSIALAVVLPLWGFSLLGTLREQFFPPTDRSQIRMVVELPNSRTLEATEQVTQAIRQRCLENERIQDVHWFLGRSQPKFYYNLMQNRDREPYYGEALIDLKDTANTRDLIRGLQKDLEARFPEARPRVIQLEQGPPFEAPVEIHLFGADQAAQKLGGEILRRALAENPEVASTRATLSDDLAQLEMILDLEQVRRAGLEPRDVARFLALSTQGSQVGTVFEDTEKLPVRLRLEDGQRKTLQELGDLQMATPKGPVPLRSLLSWNLKPEQAVLAHRQQQRCNSVQAFLQAGALPSKVLAPLVQKLESGELQLPVGVRYELGGEASERNRAVGNLVVYILPLTVMMVGSLVLAFRSFRLALLVGLVGLLSAGSGFATLAMLNIPFGFMAIIGFMGLIGVAVNDSTVVVTALQEDAADGDLDKVAATVARSTRHVVATTLTTVGGFMPLLFGADRFWHPLAAMIAGGVAGATLLALLLCPIVFRWTRRGLKP